MRGMSRNRSLARSIMDGAFGEFRRQIVYKARMTGALLVVADRWYPSSQDLLVLRRGEDRARAVAAGVPVRRVWTRG